MYKHILILLLLLFLIKFINSKRQPKFKTKYFFTNKLSTKKLSNAFLNIQNGQKLNLDGYTLNKFSVLYSKNDKKKGETGNKSRISKKLYKSKLPLSDVVEENDNDEVLDDNIATDQEIKISNQLLKKLLTTTSTIIHPDYHSLTRILYQFSSGVSSLTDYPELNTQISGKTGKEKGNRINKDKINGIFLTGNEGKIEKLIIGLTPRLISAISQSNKDLKSLDPNSSGIHLMSLSPGFFTKIYRNAVFPFLSQTFKKCFNAEIDDKYGLMGYISRIYENYDDFEVDLPIFEDELTEVFKSFTIPIKKVIDSNLFSSECMECLTVLMKCIKDMVYFNSCLKFLEYIIGRKPTDKEVAYSFLESPNCDPNDKTNKGYVGDEMGEQFMKMLEYSEKEIEFRFDRFFTPFADIAIERFRANVKSRFLRVFVSCFSDCMSAIKRRLFGVHPEIMNSVGSRFITQLFSIAYSNVKMSAITQNLPHHLPLATLRIAKKALNLTEYLLNLQRNTIASLRGGANREDLTLKSDSVKVGEISVVKQEYDRFVGELIAIEERFRKRRGEFGVNSYMKKLSQERLVEDTVSRVLGVSLERVKEAIDAYETKEVDPYERIPKYMRPRQIVNQAGARMSGYYADLMPLDVDIGVDELDYYRDLIYVRSMRKLAIEALDDRLTRLIFMAYHNLFLEPVDYHEVIEGLGITRKVADFILFTATLRAKEYEVWRIKLNLPPYVNEFKVYPQVLAVARLSMNNLPFHICPDYSDRFSHQREKSKLSGGMSNKRERNKRMRVIKPNLSSPTQLLMKFKLNFKENERLLKRSPIYYLKP